MTSTRHKGKTFFSIFWVLTTDPARGTLCTVRRVELPKYRMKKHKKKPTPTLESRVLGDRIKAARLACGLSVGTLEHLSKVARATIYRIEAGQGVSTLSRTVAALDAALSQELIARMGAQK